MRANAGAAEVIGYNNAIFQLEFTFNIKQCSSCLITAVKTCYSHYSLFSAPYHVRDSTKGNDIVVTWTDTCIRSNEVAGSQHKLWGIHADMRGVYPLTWSLRILRELECIARKVMPDQWGIVNHSFRPNRQILKWGNENGENRITRHHKFDSMWTRIHKGPPLPRDNADEDCGTVPILPHTRTQCSARARRTTASTAHSPRQARWAPRLSPRTRPPERRGLDVLQRLRQGALGMLALEVLLVGLGVGHLRLKHVIVSSISSRELTF